MRALKFKITIDSLILKDWDEWKREDQDFIEKCARQNDISTDYDPKYDELTFTGKQEDLFFFLHGVAYRYDIELI